MCENDKAPEFVLPMEKRDPLQYQAKHVMPLPGMYKAMHPFWQNRKCCTHNNPTNHSNQPTKTSH